MKPYLELTFTDTNTKVVIDPDYIIDDSIVFEDKILNANLSPLSSLVRLSITKKCTYTEEIIKTKKDIKAQLYYYVNTAKKILFTGYVAHSMKWEVTDNGQTGLSLTLEDIGTRLLKNKFKKDESIPSSLILRGTAEDAITLICNKAGVQRGNTPSLKQEIFYVIQDSDTYESVLKQLVKECLYTYYFNEEGRLMLEDIALTANPYYVIDKSNLYTDNSGTAISLKQNVKKYGFITAKWTEIEKKLQQKVYEDISGRDENNRYCHIEVPPRSTYPDKENGLPANTKTEDLENGLPILYLENPKETFKFGGGSLRCKIGQFGKDALAVEVKNISDVVGYIYRLEGRADITVEKAKTQTTAGDDISHNLEVEVKFLHDKDNIEKYTKYLANYYNYCNQEYTFNTTRDMKLGDVCTLKDETYSGLDVQVFLLEKKYTAGGLYTYKAVGVQPFDINNATSTTVLNPSISPNGVPGLTAYTHFAYANSPDGSKDFSTTDSTNKAYIGQYSDHIEDDSQDYTKYSWIKVKGENGRPGDPGKPVPTLNIATDKTQVTYYADNVPVDPNEKISISVREIGLDQNITVTWGKGSSQIVTSPAGIVEIPVLALLESDVLDVVATCGGQSASVSIAKQKLLGDLYLKTDNTFFNFYADDVPHNTNDKINVSVESIGFSQESKLYLDGKVVPTVEGFYQLDVNYLIGKPYATLTYSNSVLEKAITITKQIDEGILTLTSDKDAFLYYADNVSTNTAEKITLTIAQSGFSRMPDLYIDDVATSYTGNTYILTPNLLQNKTSLSCSIRNGRFRDDLKIRKTTTAPNINIVIDNPVIDFTVDNKPLIDKTKVRVTYSGLHYLPKLLVDNKEVALSPDGIAEISINPLLTKSVMVVKAIASKVVTTETQALITKNVIDLHLSFDMSASQFSYDKDGKVEPQSITITNTTTGLNDLNLVTLMVGPEAKTWVDNKFTLTPSMVPNKYTVITIGYGKETSSAIVINTYDGQDGQSGNSIKNIDLFYPTVAEFTLAEWKEKGVVGSRLQVDDVANQRDFKKDDIAIYTGVITDRGNRDCSIYMKVVDLGVYEKHEQGGIIHRVAYIIGEVTAMIYSDKGDNAGGEYLGAYGDGSEPTTRPDGSAIQDGDYYLVTSHPDDPYVYRRRDGVWYMVTESDKDWSKIMADTIGDVIKWNGEILSTSSYYGYFAMLAAQKAFINQLASNKIILNKDGEIVSENYESSNGTEGFRLASNGDVDFYNGTWRGSFANGLVFNAPTKCNIDKNMTQKEAYEKLKKAGIGEGVYNGHLFINSQSQRCYINKNNPGLYPEGAYTDTPFTCLDYDTSKVNFNIPVSLTSRTIAKFRYPVEVFDPSTGQFHIDDSIYKYSTFPVSFFGPLGAVIPFTYNSYILALLTYDKEAEYRYNIKGYYLLKQSGLEAILNTDWTSVPPEIQQAKPSYLQISDYEDRQGYYARADQFFTYMANLAGLIKIPELEEAFMSYGEKPAFYFYPAVTNNANYIFFDSRMGDGHGIKSLSALLDSDGTDYRKVSYSFGNYEDDRIELHLAPFFPMNNVRVNGNTVSLFLSKGMNANKKFLRISAQATFNTIPDKGTTVIDIPVTDVSEWDTNSVIGGVTVDHKTFGFINVRENDPGDGEQSFYKFAELTNGVVRPIPNDQNRWRLDYSIYNDKYEKVYYQKDNAVIANLLVHNGFIYGHIRGTTFRYEIATDKYFDMTIDLACVHTIEAAGAYNASTGHETVISGTHLKDRRGIEPIESTCAVTCIEWDKKENAIMFNYKTAFRWVDDKFDETNPTPPSEDDFWICTPVYYYPDTGQYKVFATSTTQRMLDSTNPSGIFTLISNNNKRLFVADNGVLYFNGFHFNLKERLMKNYTINEVNEAVMNEDNSIAERGITVYDQFTDSPISALIYSLLMVFSKPTLKYLDKGLESLAMPVPLKEFKITTPFPVFSRRIIIRETKDAFELAVPTITLGFRGGREAGMLSDWPVVGGGMDGYIKCDNMVPFLIIKKDSLEPVGASFTWRFPAQLTTTDDTGPVLNMLAQYIHFSKEMATPQQIDMAEIQRMIDEAVKNNLSEVAAALDEVNGEQP